ncbi:uncharacterized protein [Pocillopora verrucosa]|uniref:uncharacterized protein n=1 Tax=Pocillopora verrucosa TaxID=203993 RepID=UPI00334148E0
MYPMALAKNSLDDAVDLARTTRAMNISTTLKHCRTTLSFASIPEVVCDLSTPGYANDSRYDHRPSLESFLQESKTDADQDLRLSGLAVVSRLANASQPLVDVSKSRIHVDKIALVTLKDDTAFSCGDLALNAQNAGYSVVLFWPYFGGYCESDEDVTKPHTQEEILIPFVFVKYCDNQTTSDSYNTVNYDHLLKAVHKTAVDFIMTDEHGSDELGNMAEYLKILYYWFLLGPIITLEWLRRKKKLCCVTISQQVHEESAAGNEENARLVPRVDEDQEQNVQDITGGEIESESQLLITTADTDTDITIFDLMGRIIVRVTRIFGIRYLAVCLGYVLLTLAALPVGISSGGWSFFRFDEQERNKQKNFWDSILPDNSTEFSPGIAPRVSCILILWWSAVQIFCFFIYSKFNCASTWTVLTNVSKLIRSDWFSSNMYLFVLCAIVPYCSVGPISPQFLYFTVYNMMCTVSNFLFIIILNKHKVVTRYVFYISVCMICAYVESDIVAVFYFILNSQGSLNNLKLTALRTVALGLTLTLSFSSSMHIIRKLMKPQESVFEGLSER